MIGQFVLIRAHSAGVHMGILKSMNNTVVELTDSRRLYYWRGANTLNEVSQNGVAEDSKISESVPFITITEAIEIIPCSEKAIKNLSRSRWG